MAKVSLQDIDQKSLKEDISIPNMLRRVEELKDIICPEKFECSIVGEREECYKSYNSCSIYNWM